MIVLLEVHGQTVAIFEKDHRFFVSLGGKTLETPFPSYHAAYDWVRRVFPAATR